MRPSSLLAVLATAALLAAPTSGTAQTVPETSGKSSAAASPAAHVKTGSQRRIERHRRAPPRELAPPRGYAPHRTVR